MEFKGTKGKWYKGVTSDVKQVGTKKVVADCCFFSDDKTTEQANAQLIAHAPDMLEFIKSIFEDYENVLIDDVEHLAIRAELLYNKATTI